MQEFPFTVSIKLIVGGYGTEEQAAQLVERIQQYLEVELHRTIKVKKVKIAPTKQ